MNTPIYRGLAQSDLDMNHFNLLNWSGGGGGGGAGTGLDVNTVTADDIGLVGDGVTDNTTALQTWLNSVQTAKVSSTLLVPDGIYVFSGPLQDGSRRNAQILLPTVASSDGPYSVTIKGYHPINFVPWPNDGTHIPVPDGPIFKTTLAVGSGTRPAFIGGRGPIGGVGPENNYLLFRLENMIFQTPSNPQITCLNFDHLSASELKGDILIVAGGFVSEADVVQPTTTTSYGLIYPGFSLSIVHSCDNVNVFGFYNGVLLGENCTMSIIGAWACYNGFEIGFAYGVIIVGTLSMWHCPYGLNVTGGPIQLRINLFNTEHVTSGWGAITYDIVDPSHNATGDITWWQNTANVGPGTDFRVNGGARLKTRRVGDSAYTVATLPWGATGKTAYVSDGTANLAWGATVTGGGSTAYLVWHNGVNWVVIGDGSGGSVVYIGTDARLTSISGGVKLEVRNTSTNTWVEATRYTNP